jgi:hypothetical protein
VEYKAWLDLAGDIEACANLARHILEIESDASFSVEINGADLMLKNSARIWQRVVLLDCRQKIGLREHLLRIACIATRAGLARMASYRMHLTQCMN